MYDVKKKDHNLAQYNNYTMSKTLSMFEWAGLPETIPYFELEKLLQKHGFAFITEVEGELYAFWGGIGGVQDVYGNPTQITINNVALGFNKTLDIKEDGVLVYNDDCMMGLLPLITKFNSALVENDISLYMAGITSRMQTVISASDDKTKTSAENYVQKLIDGDVSVIGEAALFDGVKRQDATSSQGSAFTSLIEFHQYVKASLHNELGLNSNFNMKRERLTSGEVESVEDTLYPFIDNMMKCRLKAVELINAKYSTEIEVDYGSVWSKKNRELVDDIIEPENTTGGDVSTDNLKNSPSALPSNGQQTPLESSLENSPNEPTDESTNGNEEPLEEPLDDSETDRETDSETDSDKAEVLAQQISEAETMLEDETLSDEDREVWASLLEELKGAE